MNTPAGQALDIIAAPRLPFAMRPEEKRPFLQELYTQIAARYDWFNRLASCGMDQGWRKQALEHSRLRPGMRLLDVCTGTGDLALLAARRIRAGTVVGLDMNRAMLSWAQQKCGKANLPIGWLQADALCLPFADNAFDRITIGFSMRNLADLPAGLKEILRVLSPAGQLIILETGRPSHWLLRAGYHLFLHTFARLIGWVLTGKAWPFTYLARSVQQFLSPGEFSQLLESRGADAVYRPLCNGLVSLFIATKRQAV
jgi:demethylmenaquinone methyltransferase/2-methoxy-6-polyprenyl-1,4-benzoquinol methylase